MGDINKLFATGQMGGQQQAGPEKANIVSGVGAALGLNLAEAKGISNYDTQGILAEKNKIVRWGGDKDSRSFTQRIMNSMGDGYLKNMAGIDPQVGSSSNNGSSSSGGGGSTTTAAASGSSGSSAPVSSGGGGGGGARPSSGGGGSGVGGGQEGLAAAIASLSGISISTEHFVPQAAPIHIAESHAPPAPMATPPAPPTADGPLLA